LIPPVKFGGEKKNYRKGTQNFKKEEDLNGLGGEYCIKKTMKSPGEGDLEKKKKRKNWTERKSVGERRGA